MWRKWVGDFPQAVIGTFSPRGGGDYIVGRSSLEPGPGDSNFDLPRFKPIGPNSANSKIVMDPQRICVLILAQGFYYLLFCS